MQRQYCLAVLTGRGLRGQRCVVAAVALGLVTAVCLGAEPVQDKPAATEQKAAPQQSAADAKPAASWNLYDLSVEELLAITNPTVTTASKLPEKATHTPGTTIVVDKRDIQLRGYSNLKDVLRDLPGMETVEQFFSEFGTQVPVRGIAGNNKIVVLVNGMRVNPPGGESFPFRSDFSVRDAEQIEVVYGGNSTLYGPDAMSAVINVKTRKAANSPMVEAGVDGGINNEREAWASFAKVFDKSENISLTGYVQYHDSDLTRLDKSFTSFWRDYEDVAAAKGAGTKPYREDFGVNALLRLEVGDSSVQAWHRQSERSSAEAYGPVLGYLHQGTWGDRSTVVEARNTLAITDKIKLDSSFTYNRYEIDPDTRYVHPESDTQWYMDDFKYGIGHGFIFEETVKVNLTSKLTLVGGAVASWYSIVPKATFPGGVDLDDDLLEQQGAAIPYYTEPGNPASLQVIPGVVKERYQRYAGYMELGWQATDRFKMVFGGRFDRDSRLVKPSWAPRFSAIYSVTDALTTKYTFARAYSETGPYFKFATFDNGTQLATSNPSLQPETAMTHEIAVSYVKKNMSFGMSTYYGEESGVVQIADRALPANIIQDPVYLDLAGTQRRTLVHSVNAGEGRSIGVDLYGRATVGRVSPWFSYSFVDYKEKTDEATSTLRGASRHNGRLGVTWAALDRFLVTPSFTIRSTPQNVSPDRLGRELQTPWELNLHLVYKVNRHFDVFLDARNITNHRNALGGFTGHALPQETFRGVLGARMTF